MKKLLVIIPLLLILTGCGTTKTHIIYKDKYVPIPIVPQPPVVESPDYYINSLTEEQKNDIGELSKAYVISGQEAINYTRNLREVYESYKQMAKNSESRLKALENMGAVVDRSLFEDANKEISNEIRELSSDIKKNDEELSKTIQETLEKTDDKP